MTPLKPRGTQAAALFLLAPVLLLVLSASTAAAAADSTTPTPPPSSDALRYWLYNLEVALPSQSFAGGGVNFTLTELRCGQVQLGAVNSSLAGTRYTIGLTGLGIACTGHWRGTSKIAKPEEGKLGLALERNNLTLGMQLHTDADGLAVNATAFGVRAQMNITEIDFEGANWFIRDVLKLILPELEKGISKALSKDIPLLLEGLINKELTALLQEVNKAVRPYIHPGPPPVPPPVPDGAADLRNSSLLHLIDYFVDDILGGSGNFSLNHIVDALTGGTGRVDLAHLKLSLPLVIPDLATIVLTVDAIDVDGLDSWGSLALLNPVARYLVDSNSYLDRLGLNVTFIVAVNLTGSELTGPSLVETGRFVMRLDKARLDFLAQLAVDAAASRNLKPAQLLNGGCLLSTIDDFNMTRLALNFTLAQLAIEAGSGKHDTEVDVDQAIDRLLALFTNNYGPAIPAALNGILAGPVRQGVNAAVASAYTNATCAAPAKAGAHKGEVDYAAVYAASGGAAALFIIFVFILRRHHQEHLEKEGTLDRKQAENSPLLRRNASSMPLLDGSSEAISLSAERAVSTPARYLIPLAILGTAAIFIYSNTSSGASVYPEVTLGTEKIRFGYLFTFTLGNSVRDMWNSEVYALSLLIGVFSGAWPYLKLVLLLFCWAAPMRWLGSSRRETFLQVLDALGKWSLIDTYVMVMMLVAFRFHLPAPHDTSTNATALDIYVEPQVGIYTFILATVVSLILTHVILHMHRSAERQRDPPSPSAEREALWRHHFGIDNNDGGFRLTPFGSFFVTMILLGTLAIIMVGAIIPAFAFNFQGLAGWALQADHLNPIHNFSLISLGNEIPTASPAPNELGIRTLQAVFFTIALSIPLAHVASLVAVWVIPMRTVTLSRIFHMVEVLNAWAGLDVFVVALLAAVLEIERFAQFIIGDLCDPINVILAKYFDKELHGDDKCFDVTTTLNNGSWLLFGACVIHILASLIIMRLCHRAVHERLYAGRGRHIKMHTSRSIQQDLNAKSGSKSQCCGLGDVTLNFFRYLRLVAPEEYNV